MIQSIPSCEFYNDLLKSWNLYPNITAETIHTLPCHTTTPATTSRNNILDKKYHLYSCIQIGKKMHSQFIR